MTVFEKIKEMPLDKFLANLRSVSREATDFYCLFLCSHDSKSCALSDNRYPCDNVDVLLEVLNADYELFMKYIYEAYGD